MLLVTREQSYPQDISVVLEQGSMYLMHGEQLIRPGNGAVVESLASILLDCSSLEQIVQVTT